ncbi:hypothetical protein ACIQPQ_03475 [Streptomyces sp. NPDC091281]|uniref:hypothetical protein n=1 Tax=Streptomyces sp. NPDC091281 TaxID=3365985 RepID=UPI0037F74F93
MDGPVNLPDRVFSRPTPVPGCPLCADLDRQWVKATSPGSEAYDPSKSSDLVIELARHKKDKHEVSL